MIVANGLNETENLEPGGVVGLGTFDGVHLGHRAIMNRVVSLAKDKGVKSIILTFTGHPMEAIAPDRAPARIQTNSQREELIRNIGIDVLVQIEFTKEFASLSARSFVEEILMGRLKPSSVVVGSNYTFGKGAEGGAELLKRLGEEYGFEVHNVEPVRVRGTVVSSTHIRGLISKGDMEAAREFLGRPFRIDGVVEHGYERGRSLGFPTLNIPIPPGIITPPYGVYLVNADLPGGSRYGVCNIGTRPTFKGDKPNIEAYIFDFSGEAYGERVGINFLKFIRKEMNFEEPERLASQVKEDIEVAKRMLALHTAGGTGKK